MQTFREPYFEFSCQVPGTGETICVHSARKSLAVEIHNIKYVLVERAPHRFYGIWVPSQNRPFCGPRTPEQKCQRARVWEINSSADIGSESWTLERFCCTRLSVYVWVRLAWMGVTVREYRWVWLTLLHKRTEDYNVSAFEVSFKVGLITSCNKISLFICVWLEIQIFILLETQNSGKRLQKCWDGKCFYFNFFEIFFLCLKD